MVYSTTLSKNQEREVSDEQPLKNGTPQGSVIYPLLFIIMANDFPTTFDKTIETSLYADDSEIFLT